MLRTIIFWSHLAVGLVSGALIFLLCLTGAILSFEIQLVDRCERDARARPAEAGMELLPPAEIAARATIPPGERLVSLEWSADPGMPVRTLTDKRTVTLLNGYSGEVLGPGAVGLRGFLRRVTQLHTTLVAGTAGHWAIAVANAGFVFLIVSGLWLWWPRQWRWKAFRAAMTPSWRLGGRARDWNWHTTLGFWFLLPLLLIAGTGLVLSFDAVDRWWRAFGGTRVLSAPLPVATAAAAEEPQVLRWSQWVSLIGQRAPGWRSFIIGGNGMPNGDGLLTCSVNFGSPRHRASVVQLKLDTRSGRIREERGWANEDGPVRARALARLGHSGEIAGTVGQAIGLLACLAGCVLVWTGFALSWRRFARWRSARGERPADRS